MNILGISPRCEHDGAAAIVVDGRPIAAAEEERFTRVKHDGSFPAHAIDFCLGRAGLTMKDVDAVAVPWFGINDDSPVRDLLFSLRTWEAQELPSRRRQARASLFHKLRRLSLRRQRGSSARDPGLVVVGDLRELAERYPDAPVVTYIDHHRAHAASAFYPSGFDEAAVVTIDGGGYFFATAAWRGRRGRLEWLRGEPVTNSTGFYIQLTRFLNLGEFGEGKTMGLSSYGKPDPEMTRRVKQHIFDADEGTWYTDRLFPPLGSDRPIHRSGLDIPPRTTGSPLEAPYPDLTFAAQKELERALWRVSEYATRRSRSRRICLAGGVALNCVANSTLLTSGLVDEVFVFPAAHDSGAVLGAALEAASRVGDPVGWTMDNAALGPDFSDREVHDCLARSGLPFSPCPDVASEAAALIAQGSVIGWFQGRMEFGPRALGHRSIVADPRRAHLRDAVNRIKGREAWRPLAPAVLEECAAAYFEGAVPSPFMLLSFQVKRERWDEIPAVVHVDGSTRPQTLAPARRTPFRSLVEEFHRQTGVPLVLNTSFNLKDEPIVCTPADAVDSFRRSSLDYLAIGPFIVRRPA